MGVLFAVWYKRDELFGGCALALAHSAQAARADLEPHKLTANQHPLLLYVGEPASTGVVLRMAHIKPIVRPFAANLTLYRHRPFPSHTALY